jgi:hypothetical protein
MPGVYFGTPCPVEMTGFYALDPRADPRADSGVEALNARYSMTGVDGFL